MTATYTLDPSNVPVDAVRLMVGDTNVSSASLQDEEIQYFIDRYAGGNTPTETHLILASMDAIRAIIAKIESSIEEEQAGKIRVRMFSRVKSLLELVSSLEKKLGSLSTPQLFLGGMNKARYDANKESDVNTKPKFEVDMFINKGVEPDAEG